MSQLTPRPRPAQVARRTALELARIYVSASAYESAIESLDRLPINGWDEEARLLRAEALVGLGRVLEADKLLGPPVLPTSIVRENTCSRSAFDESEETLGPVESFDDLADLDEVGESSDQHGELVDAGQSSDHRENLHAATRHEERALWRFQLQLRVLHRRGQYRHVVELGRTFFDGQKQPPTTIVARLAMVVAQSMLALRKPSEARDLFEHVLDLFDRLGSKEGRADALLGIANTHLLDCHWDEADAIYQEARFRYEEIGQTEKALAALINLGVLRVKRGEFASGKDLLTQAWTGSQRVGASRRVATIRLGLAMAAIRTGDEEAARGHLAHVLRSSRARGAQRDYALALEFAGEYHMSSGRLTRAARLLSRAEDLAAKMAPDGDIAFEVKRRLAEVALARKDVESARLLAARSARSARRYGDVYEAATCERVLAEVDLYMGDVRSAAARVEAAGEMLDRLGETFERARIGLLALRLKHSVGTMASVDLSVHVSEVCRPFSAHPASLVRREGERLLESIVESSPRQYPRRLREPAAVQRSDDRLSAEDLHLLESYGLVTRDSELLRTLALAKNVAALDVPVLIRAEPGSGFEILARVIHRWSGRNGLYIPFHCVELGAAAMERELWGQGEHGGLSRAADGGTLFLDGMADLGAEAQRLLVRWLQEQRERLPAGGVRVIASDRQRGPDGETGTDPVIPALRHELSRVVLEIPSLRARRPDVPLQIDCVLRLGRRRYGSEIPRPPDELLIRWMDHSWPGNLRELRDVVERYIDRVR